MHRRRRSLGLDRYAVAIGYAGYGRRSFVGGEIEVRGESAVILPDSLRGRVRAKQTGLGGMARRGRADGRTEGDDQGRKQDSSELCRRECE
jgi:hypothetical protein